MNDYKKRFGANFGANLKADNLSGPYEIHAQYRARLKQFYSHMLAELKKPQNLNQPNAFIETDREKAPFFKSEEEQRAHWNKMLVSQLINLNISKQEEQAKQNGMTSRLALPGSRKAALWDYFVRSYGETAGEIEDDFHTLFGEAFLHAYDMEVNQYKDSQSGSEDK